MDIQGILIVGIRFFTEFLSYAILIRVILSWFVSRDNPLMNFLDVIVEPILGPIRNMMYKSPLGGPGMGLDFSPMIAYFFIYFASNILINIIRIF